MAEISNNYTSANLSVLDNLPVGVVLFDNKQVHFMNQKALDIFQVPKTKQKNIHDLSIFEFLEKRFHSRVKNDNVAILKGLEQPTRVELEFSTFKKKTIFIEVHSSVALLDNKKVLQSTFTEISDRKSQRQELEEAKDLLLKITENSLDVIFHFGFSGDKKLKFISNSSKKILGFDSKEIIKNPDLLIAQTHPDDRKHMVLNKSAFQNREAKKNNRNDVIRFHHKNGSLKFLEIAINPVYDENKELIGLIGDMRDVTERIEAENLLIETKEKFDLITRNSNDLIAFFTYYPQPKYLYASPNIKNILGYEPEELLKNSNFFAQKIVRDKDDFMKEVDLMKKYQANNTVKNHYIEFKIRKKNGEEVWLDNSLVPITDSKGKISFFLNIMRDKTEQKEKNLEIENQYTNYQNLLDNSPAAYMIHDKGVCIYLNNAALKLVKAKYKNQVIGKQILEHLVGPGDRERAKTRIQELYGQIPVKKPTQKYTICDLMGDNVEVEINSVLIKYNTKDCILIQIDNITERKQRETEKLISIGIKQSNKKLQKEIREREEIEKHLIEKSAHLSSIFESSTHLVWTVNRDLQVTSFNRNFYHVVKMQHGIAIKVGYRIDEHLLRNRDEYKAFWYTKYEEAFKGKKLEFEKEDYNERKVYRKIFLNPIYNKDNEVTEISCIANDITDSKIYEQKLIHQTGKLTAIFDSSHHYIWTINREEKLTSFNKNYYDLITGLYNTKPYVGLILDRGVLANDKKYNEVLQFHYEKAFHGIATNFEIETKDKENRNVYLEIFLNPIYGGDTVVEVSGIAHNVTEKKLVQQRMELSLKEKEILLREVHHRVKNNMQVVSSILNLQSSYVSDEYALTLLKESQNRIKTMAYIHESLYQNKSFTSVNFSDYIYTLVNNIVQSYSYSREKIKLDLQIEKITLSLDSSIPAGLIVNELITNSIKHAFPGTREGTISVNLRCENNFVILSVKDDGVGFADGVDFEHSNSLGLQLVNTLIEQIEGKLKFNSGKETGTKIQVAFKM